MTPNASPGTYILVIECPRETRIRVSALGPLVFEAGYYLYVGSALGGLSTRLARHLRAAKRLHWHIDYLLGEARIGEIWYSLGRQRRECAWARALARMPGVEPFHAPFGATDCACRTHLLYGRSRPRVESFRGFAKASSMRVVRRAALGAGCELAPE